MDIISHCLFAFVVVPIAVIGIKRARNRCQELRAAYQVRRVLGRRKNIHRKRGDVIDELLAIDDDTFRRMFRMPKQTFMELEQSIAPILRDKRRWSLQSEHMASVSSGSSVKTIVLLAATIRLCACEHI